MSFFWFDLYCCLKIGALILLLAGALSIVFYSLWVGISPMPSSCKAKKAILNCVPQNALVIYELGAGWGTLTLALAKQFPQAKVYGFELSLIPFLVCFLRAKISGLTNLKIVRANFFKVSLTPASCIVCYLAPRIMAKLALKLKKELNPKTCVITNSFSLPGWNVEKQMAVDDLWGSEIIVYL